jgi:hypothetical protein
VRVAISPAAGHGMVRLCHIAAAMSQLTEIMAILEVGGGGRGGARPAVLVFVIVRGKCETIKQRLLL